MIKILSWDWREQIPIDELASALKILTDGKVHLYEVDTESDQFGFVLSDAPLEDHKIDEHWMNRWK